MGVGIYRTAKGKFDLVLSVRYNASPGELDEWETAFELASRLLFDATDGQHQFGNIYVFNDDYNNDRDTADAYLLSNNLVSHAAGGYAQLGFSSSHMELGRDERFRPFVIVHEFGHYVYGLYDEYIRGGVNDPFGEDETAHCIVGLAGAAANACIMEASWQDGDRINEADGLLTLGQISEFCSQQIPEVLGPNYHSHDNLQQHERLHSCWDEMVIAGPENGGGNFDLILPLAPDDLPEENTARADAAPINWVVLGQQQRFMLVLDRSGSMAGDKLEDSKIGAKFWADASITGDRLGVISYSHTVTPNYPLDEIQDDMDRGAVRDAIHLISAGGATAIGDGLRAGLNQILADIMDISERGKNIIALLTDGHHNTGEAPGDVLPDLIDNGVQVYTIGVGPGVNENLLAEIAHRTGAEYFPIDPDLESEVQQTEIRDALILIEGIAHGGGLVDDLSGSTNPGVREEIVYIEPGSRMAVFTLSWNNPEDLLYLELESPNGDLITLNSTPPGVRPVHSQNNPYMSFQVETPAPGDWKLIISPKQVAEVAYYRIFVFSRNPHISGGVVSPAWIYQPGLVLPVKFQCYFDHPLTGIKVSGTVKLPSGERIALEFSDDGNKELGDVLRGDGLYHSLLTKTDKPGMYTIEVVAESDGQAASYGRVSSVTDEIEDYGSEPIPRFRRKFRRTVGVGRRPLKDASLEPNRGYPGEKLQVTLKGQHTHFRRGYTAVDFGEGIESGEVDVLDKHTAQVMAYVDESAQPGARNVTITTASYRETVEVEDGFLVKAVRPPEA